MSVSAPRPLPPSHRIAIREIFLRRRHEYTTRDAARLLRLTLGDLLAWIDSGALHVERRRKRRQLGGRRHAMVAWSELASAAMLRWSVVEIHDALGKDASGVLPRLLRPVELKSVRLPEYQIRLLETLAQRAGVTLEGYVYTALLSLETAASPEAIERVLPGFREAMSFPEKA